MTEEDFIHSLQSKTTDTPKSPTTDLSAHISHEEREIQKNQAIIDASNQLITERIKYNDDSLRLTDVISAKAEAFKQIRMLQGKDDNKQDQLIPSQINIQIINN